MSSSHTIIEISSQPIELCKLLKIANMVSGGGEAKIVISEGYILLNNEVELQKRKKIYDKDVIEFNGETIEVVVKEITEISQDLKKDRFSASQSVPTKKILPQQKQPKQPKQPKQHNKTAVLPLTTTKRKPISF